MASPWPSAWSALTCFILPFSLKWSVFLPVLQNGLKENFADVQASVVDCPDMTQEPFCFPVKGNTWYLWQNITHVGNTLVTCGPPGGQGQNCQDYFWRDGFSLKNGVNLLKPFQDWVMQPKEPLSHALKCWMHFKNPIFSYFRSTSNFTEQPHFCHYITRLLTMWSCVGRRDAILSDSLL